MSMRCVHHAKHPTVSQISVGMALEDDVGKSLTFLPLFDKNGHGAIMSIQILMVAVA